MDLSYFHHGPISNIVLASVLKIIDKPVILASVQQNLSDNQINIAVTSRLVN